jgi:hypothetical protein
MNEPAAPVSTRAACNSPRIWTVTCGRWSDSSVNGRSFGGVGGDGTGFSRAQSPEAFPVWHGQSLDMTPSFRQREQKIFTDPGAFTTEVSCLSTPPAQGGGGLLP